MCHFRCEISKLAAELSPSMETSSFASPPHDEFAFINPVGLVFDRWALGIETDGRTYDSTAR